jgi:hypothetical protein
MTTTHRKPNASTTTESTPMLAWTSPQQSPAARRHAWISRITILAAYGSVLWVVLSAGLCNPPRPGDFRQGPPVAGPATPTLEQLIA